jgi:hypothetical protein
MSFVIPIFVYSCSYKVPFVTKVITSLGMFCYILIVQNLLNGVKGRVNL